MLINNEVKILTQSDMYTESEVFPKRGDRNRYRAVGHQRQERSLLSDASGKSFGKDGTM